MSERRERPERENPISFLPSFKNFSPDFGGLFIVLAVIGIIYFYWNPFGAKEKPVKKDKTESVSNENIPVPLNSPDNTVMIVTHEDRPEELGVIDPLSDPVKALAAIKDYLTKSGIDLEEYKKGSFVKSDWMNDTKLDKSVQMVFQYDGRREKIVASVNTKSTDKALKQKIDSKAIFKKASQIRF